MPALAQALAEQAADQAGERDHAEVEEDGEPVHVVAANEADEDEHGLGGEVGAGGGDDAVAERRPGTLRPRRAPGAERRNR